MSVPTVQAPDLWRSISTEVQSEIESGGKLEWEGGSAADRRPRYDSATQAYRKILYEEGMRDGLYRGYFPNLIRNSVISATELVNRPHIIPVSTTQRAIHCLPCRVSA